MSAFELPTQLKELHAERQLAEETGVARIASYMADLERDIARIIEYRLSPLYVSVHATNWEARKKLLNNPRVPNVMEQLRRLAERPADDQLEFPAADRAIAVAGNRTPLRCRRQDASLAVQRRRRTGPVEEDGCTQTGNTTIGRHAHAFASWV